MQMYNILFDFQPPMPHFQSKLASLAK